MKKDIEYYIDNQSVEQIVVRLVLNDIKDAIDTGKIIDLNEKDLGYTEKIPEYVHGFYDDVNKRYAVRTKFINERIRYHLREYPHIKSQQILDYMGKIDGINIQKSKSGYGNACRPPAKHRLLDGYSIKGIWISEKLLQD